MFENLNLFRNLPYRVSMLMTVLCCAFSSINADESFKSPDVRFIYLAKWVNYVQKDPGRIDLIDFGYGAQIFAVADGRIKQAVLSGPLPGGIDLILEDDGDKYPGQNLRFTSQSISTLNELNRAFPDGRYNLALQTQTGNYKDHVLHLNGAASGLAKAAVLKLMQCKQHITTEEVSPGEDLIISWSAFNVADADPRGIMDDLIVVKLSDAKGSVIKRSPLPFFSNVPVIRHDTLSYSLSGDLLKPATSYVIDVEHINVVDSHIRAGMPEVAAYVTNTKLAIHSSDTLSESHCEKSESVR